MEEVRKMEEEPKFFVRRTSGLVREFGLFDTFAFNVLGYAVGLVVMVTPLFVGGLFPGANIYLMLIIGSILTAFNGITYGLLSTAMPRSGGEYIYNGRVLHPAIGFMSNWGFSWSQFLGIGIYAAWTTNYALSTALTTLGYITNNPTAIRWGELVATKVVTWGLGTIFLLSVALLLLVPTRWLRKFLSSGFIIATIGSAATAVVFFMHSKEDFVAIFNDFMLKAKGLPDAYNSIIKIAIDLGYTVPKPSIVMTILSLSIGYWMYIGLTYSVYIGAEVKEPSKVQTPAILLSLLFGFIFYALSFVGYYRVVGGELNDALGFLNLNHPEANPIPVPPVMGFFSGLLAGNVPMNVIIGVSFFLWHYLLLVVMSTFCVRNIFAWSFDRIMPAKLTAVTRYGSPWAAAITVVVLAWTLMTLWLFTPYFTYVVNYIVIFSIAFWITSWAAILLPYRRKELFEAAPEIVRKKVFGVPLIVIAGILNMFLFTLVLISSFMLPAFSGPVGLGATLFVVGIYLSGIIIYYIAYAYRKTKGIDLNMLYKELPPE